MARIDERVLGSVIYLYQTVEDAESGDGPGGSGFLLSVKSDTQANQVHVYAVTNRHVVHDEGYSPIIRVTNASRIDSFKGQKPFMAGNREIIQLACNQWKAHPESDIAITYLGVDETIPVIGPQYGRRFGFTFPSFLLLTHEVITVFDIGHGDDVYMCGRFKPYPGKFFNEPSTRWGTIALMHSMVELDNGEEEVFLVEMRSLSGFSGSPVIWRLPVDFEFYLTALSEKQNLPHPYPVMTRRVDRDKSGPMLLGPWLVGVECGSFPVREPLRYKDREEKVKEGYETKLHSGVVAVVPAWKLQELLDLEVFAVAREEEEDKQQNNQTSARFDREVATDDDLPFLTKRGFDNVLPKVSRKTTDSDSEPESEKKPDER